jgi:hypothetical protein
MPAHLLVGQQPVVFEERMVIVRALAGWRPERVRRRRRIAIDGGWRLDRRLVAPPLLVQQHAETGKRQHRISL